MNPFVLSVIVYFLVIGFLWQRTHNAYKMGFLDKREFTMVSLGAFGWPLMSILMMIAALINRETK